MVHHEEKTEYQCEETMQEWMCDWTNPTYARSEKQVKQVAHNNVQGKLNFSLYNRPSK